MVPLDSQTLSKPLLENSEGRFEGCVKADIQIIYSSPSLWILAGSSILLGILYLSFLPTLPTDTPLPTQCRGQAGVQMGNHTVKLLTRFHCKYPSAQGSNLIAMSVLHLSWPRSQMGAGGQAGIRNGELHLRHAQEFSFQHLDPRDGNCITGDFTYPPPHLPLENRFRGVRPVFKYAIQEQVLIVHSKFRSDFSALKGGIT